MRDNHIIRMIEENSVSGLSGSEIDIIESHIADCSNCLRAYEAARLSVLLVQSRAAEAVEPSPFFQTRVMASLRQKALSPEPPPFLRMWRAAGSLVSMMAMLVVILAAAALFSFGPDPEAQSIELTASQGIYSPEYLVFEGDDLAAGVLGIEEVIGTIYDSGDGDGK